MDSSSSASDSENMFPAEHQHDPITPQQGESYVTRLTKAIGSELSPPQSQERGDEASMPNLVDNTNVHAPEASSRKEREMKEPGWGWKNPKAREEYERSMEFVLDRQFSLRELSLKVNVYADSPAGEFGELFDERNVTGLAGLKK